MEKFISDRLQNIFRLQENEIQVEVENETVTVTMNEKEYNYYTQTGIITVDKPVEKIKKSMSKVDSYVGYYADIDKDGNVDGVIFVDLLTGSIRETQSWCRNTGEYTLPADVSASNVKNYYISKESHTWAGITKPVLSPIGNGKERFYIMQLTDFTTLAKTDGTEDENYPEYQIYSFYKNANMTPLITSINFSEGSENTRKMIAKWSATGTIDGYTNATQDKQDIWKHIQIKYQQGWFIPSRAEWAAFANELGITGRSNGNYNSKYGLSDCYWSSSQSSYKHAWHARFKDYTMYEGLAENIYAIRLTKIF